MFFCMKTLFTFDEMLAKEINGGYFLKQTLTQRMQF